MHAEEIQPHLDTFVRVYLADGRILAGKLSRGGHHQYAVTTPAVDAHEQDVTETIHSADQITEIEPAPEFAK